MATVIPPTSDNGVRDFGNNFDLIVNPTPTAVGLTAAQATALHGQALDYATRLATATEPSTRTKVSIQAKETAKFSLLATLRSYIKIVDAFPNTTDAQRASLGMRIRDVSPTPVPAPATQPVVSIVGSGGGLAVVRLRDETAPDRKAKPAGVFGALLATAVTAAGDPPPAFAPSTFNAVVTRTAHTLGLPPGSAGKTLWVQATWINERGMPGPTSVVTSALIAA